MIQITSYEYRSEPLFLRNQFNGVGMFSIPLIKKQEMRRRIKPEKIICYGKSLDDMKGDIIEVDYAETNNLDKGFYIKKLYGFITPIQKGGGSALRRNSANPEHAFDENTDMPPFPGYENKAPGKDFEWRGNSDIKKNIGNWFNKKTGESFHWDINHPDPIGPHWDYFRRGIDNKYRIFPDNTWSKKVIPNWRMRL